MVTRLASGDAVAAEAEAALGDGESEKAAELLREAKSFYHNAQVGKKHPLNYCRGGGGIVLWNYRVCLRN